MSYWRVLKGHFFGCISVLWRGTLVGVVVVLLFILLHHYETTSLEGKAPTLWHQIVFQPRCSLLISSRNSWPLRAWSTTLFEWLVVMVTTFTHSPKAAKLPHWRVTISSILQWWVTSVMIILVWTLQCGLDICPLKQMLNNMNPNLRDLRGKCELHYQVPTVWSMPPKQSHINWLSKQGVPNNRCQQDKQTPAPKSIQSSQGMTDRLQRAVSHLSLCQSDTCFPSMLKSQGQNLWHFELSHTQIFTNNSMEK